MQNKQAITEEKHLVRGILWGIHEIGQFSGLDFIGYSDVSIGNTEA